MLLRLPTITFDLLKRDDMGVEPMNIFGEVLVVSLAPRNTFKAGMAELILHAVNLAYRRWPRH